jgi:ribosomal protein S18 acetylase RimI-like enzyme
VDDIPGVSRLLQSLATEFIIRETPPELAQKFLEGNSPEGIAANIANGYVYHVAEDDGVVAGFIGMRERKHVFHLFVGKQWQGQGLSRRLWDTGRRAAMEAGGAAPFTVNASNYALDAYRHLGFVCTAPMAVKNGIRFNAMEWDGKSCR